jgi:NAD(P)-dependent dehydrogenase (short-subunit alcohol dehydrogenase family)
MPSIGKVRSHVNISGGKMFVITGASRGIGKFLFEHFTDQGEAVLGTYNLTKPEAKGAENMFRVNILEPADIKYFIDHNRDRLQQIVLLNCAGNNYNALAHKAHLDMWKGVIELNLVGTFHMINAVLPIMREQGWGRVINFSSVVARVGVPGTSAYAASKSGLWGMTRAIAVENATKGITINSLNLGYFDIGMITEVPSDFQAIIKQKIPTGQFGNPENIVHAVNFLIKCDYINGTSIDINAGLT